MKSNKRGWTVGAGLKVATARPAGRAGQEHEIKHAHNNFVPVSVFDY
jgi:hypothetical protein